MLLNWFKSLGVLKEGVGDIQGAQQCLDAHPGYNSTLAAGLFMMTQYQDRIAALEKYIEQIGEK